MFTQSFEDIIPLGSGHFGDVYKAKLKRDNKYYAVKQINMKKDGIKLDNMLAEVRIISSLINEFVVRYYDSWIEVH